MEKFLDELVSTKARLSPTESTDLFITILHDLHSNKKSLIQNLPFIASKAFAEDVKLLILQSATVINGQLIRLSLAKALLGLSSDTQLSILNGGLDLHAYLKESLEIRSPKGDAIILTHLAVVEGTEIDALKILKRLARKIKPNAILQLMSVCYKEAFESKRTLEATLALYR